MATAQVVIAHQSGKPVPFQPMPSTPVSGPLPVRLILSEYSNFSTAPRLYVLEEPIIITPMESDIHAPDLSVVKKTGVKSVDRPEDDDAYMIDSHSSDVEGDVDIFLSYTEMPVVVDQPRPIDGEAPRISPSVTAVCSPTPLTRLPEQVCAESNSVKETQLAQYKPQYISETIEGAVSPTTTSSESVPRTGSPPRAGEPFPSAERMKQTIVTPARTFRAPSSRHMRSRAFPGPTRKIIQLPTEPLPSEQPKEAHSELRGLLFDRIGEVTRLIELRRPGAAHPSLFAYTHLTAVQQYLHAELTMIGLGTITKTATNRFTRIVGGHTYQYDIDELKNMIKDANNAVEE